MARAIAAAGASLALVGRSRDRLAALAPRTAERLATRLGTTRFARDAARAEGRL
jgi:NADP-dependent 3-hydroxy acid dehydrogenase YdfG